ncbi:TPA: pentapeptide repeat-containing protein [Yersinia enterocolitica]
MNNTSSYIQSRFCNSTTAAVNLAKNDPSKKNIEFAKNILRVKMSTVDSASQNSAIRNTLHPAKLEKYISLAKTLEDVIYSNLELVDVTGFKEDLFWCSDLSEKDFRGINFKSMYEDKNPVSTARGIPLEREKIDRGVFFCDSNLNGVDLSCIELSHAIFSKANLVEAKIIAAIANYSGARLDNAVISFPYQDFNSETNSHNHQLAIDLFLNDSNNHDTYFDTIRTIDDKYAEIKTDLTKQIVESLERDRVDINAHYFPRQAVLNNITSKDFYLKNDMIKTFAEKLVRSELADANDKIVLDKLSPEALSFCIKTIAQTQNHEDLKQYLIGNNGSFIQLMALCNNNYNSAIQNQARTLYSTYLRMDEVKPFVEKEEFGNGEEEPDWSDKSNLNYILINKNKAMIIDHENISKMLHLEKSHADIKWDNFYLYNDNECQSAGDINYKELFSNDFKIFEDSYNFDLNSSTFVKLLSTLELSDYKAIFSSVLSGKPVSDELKLVGTEDQLKLGSIFEKVLTRPNDSTKETMLKAEHYKEILSIFNLHSTDEKRKSQTLLALATVFSKYSSSSVFGTENESPQILRDYAYALMSKANELNPEVTGGNFNDWKDRLLGLNNAFTCTAVLSSIMIGYAKNEFNEVISEIIPPVWA